MTRSFMLGGDDEDSDEDDMARAGDNILDFEL
jgi:hypothetical protein